jgi:opacity protein-like surface antigen
MDSYSTRVFDEAYLPLSSSRTYGLCEDGMRGSRVQTKRRSDRKMRIAKIVLALLILVPAASVGQEDDRSGPYGEFRGGGLFVADSEMRFSGTPGSYTADYDAGFAISGAAGYRFDRHLRAEFEAGYQQAEIGELTIPTPGPGNLDGDWNIGVVTALVNVIYDIDYWDALAVPYVGAGLGLGYVMLDSKPAAALRVDAGSAELAWNALVGVRLRVFDNTLLSMGYRYLGTTDPDFSSSAGKVESEFSSHEIFLGIGYEF